MEHEEIKLSDLVDTISDTRKIDKDKVILVNTSDVFNGEVLNHSYTDNSNLKGQFKKRFKSHDILYSEIRPANKRFAYVDFESEDYIASTKLMILRRKSDKITNKFLYYCLTNDWFIGRMQHLAESRSGTFPQITFDVLKNETITLPSLKNQDKITIILDNINNKIKLNNKINNNLFELLLNDFNDFLDKNPDSEMVKLEDCVEKINTGADAIQRAPIVDYDTGIRCIRIGDMTNGRDYHSWGFAKMTDKDFENYKLIRNDIVITRTAVNGLTYMITNEENTVCNNGNIRLRVNNKYNPLYIYLNTKTKDFRNYIDRINSETSVRPNMKVEYFTSYEIKKIDLEKQNHFCNRAESLMTKIQNNKVENYNLEQLRDTLLPKLMKGEIDLDNIEI